MNLTRTQLAAVAMVAGLTACATGPDGRVIDAYPVVTVAWSPDGRLIAGGTNIQGEAYLLDARDQKIKAVLRVPKSVRDIHPSKGPALAFSPDSRWLATAGMTDDVGIRIWDANSGKEARNFPGSRHIRSLAFSPDGRRLAVTGPGELLTVWDFATGALLRQWAAHTGTSISVVFARDGSAIFSGGEDRTVKIWNAATFELIGSKDGFAGDVTGIGFSPDGKRMAIASAGADLQLHESDANEPLKSPAIQLVKPGQIARTEDLSLLHLLLAVGTVRSMRIVGAPTTGYPFPTAGSVQGRPPGGRTRCDPNIVFSADSTRVAAVVDQAGLHILIADLSSGTAAMTERVIGCSVAFSPDGKTLVGGGLSASVRVYDSATGTRIELEGK